MCGEGMGFGEDSSSERAMALHIKLGRGEKQGVILPSLQI